MRKARKKKYRVWLDDERPMPKEYNVHVKSACEAIKMIKEGQVGEISLDHDLGEETTTTRWSDRFNRFLAVGTGYDVAKFLEEGAYTKTVRPIVWNIHSANPVGRDNMEMALKNADKYWYNRGSEEEV